MAESFGHKIVQKRQEVALLYPTEQPQIGFAHVAVSEFERTKIIRSGYDVESRGFMSYKENVARGIVIQTVSESGEILQSREVADPEVRRRKAARYVSHALSEVTSLSVDADIPAIGDRTFLGRPVVEHIEDETLFQKLSLLVTVRRERPYYDRIAPGARRR